MEGEVRKMAAFGSPLHRLFLLTLMFCLFTGGAPEPVSTPEPVNKPEPVGTPAEPVGTPAEPVGTPAEPVGTPAEPVGTPANTPEPVPSPQERCYCSWYGWGSWSGCSKPCGNAGTRVRYKTGYCCGTISRTQECNRFCYNSGTPHSNGCYCTSRYEGRCCDVYKGSGGSTINISQTTNQSTVVGLSVTFAIIGIVLIGVAIYYCIVKCG